MELTYRQVRALVLAGKLSKNDFEKAFQTKAVGYHVRVNPDHSAIEIFEQERGQYVALVNVSTQEITLARDRLDYEVGYGPGRIIEVRRYLDQEKKS